MISSAIIMGVPVTCHDVENLRGDRARNIVVCLLPLRLSSSLPSENYFVAIKTLLHMPVCFGTAISPTRTRTYGEREFAAVRTKISRIDRLPNFLPMVLRCRALPAGGLLLKQSFTFLGRLCCTVVINHLFIATSDGEQ